METAEEIPRTKKRRLDEIHADGMPAVTPTMKNLDAKMSIHTSHASSPSLSLNASHDHGATHVKIEPNAYRVSSDVASANRVLCEEFKPNQNTQDVHELKKERRKQSNRESAKRSRLRKQKEYEHQLEKIDTLSDEIDALNYKLRKLAEDCENLRHENTEILTELRDAYGPTAISFLEAKDPSHDKSADGEASAMKNETPTESKSFHEENGDTLYPQLKIISATDELL